jgi:hypothetical protein
MTQKDVPEEQAWAQQCGLVPQIEELCGKTA